MNTLKTVVVIAVLAIVGYGLYRGLNNGFQFQNGAGETPDWLTAEIAQPGSPDIQLGTESSVPPTAGAPGTWGGSTAPATPVAPQQFPGSAVPAVTPGNVAAPAVAPGAPLSGIPASAATMPAAALPAAAPPAAAPPAAAPPAAALPAAAPPAVTTVPPPADRYRSGTTGATSHPPPQPAPAGGAAGGLNPPAADGSTTATRSRYGDPAGEAAEAGRPQPPATGAATTTDQSAFQAAMRSAQVQLSQGQLAAALLTLSIWYEDPRVDPAQHEQLVRLLDQVAGTVIYSRKHLIEGAYSVKPGERLEDIAQQYNVPGGVLAKINGIGPGATLTAGQQLKVVRGPFNAVVDTKKQTLTLWVGGRYAGRFPVRVGPEFEQIVGPFVVTNKTRQHAAHGGLPWVELGSGIHRSGASGNQSPRLGIAGVRDSGTDGQGQVPGRIAVSARDADDLFDILSQGSKVTIQR